MSLITVTNRQLATEPLNFDFKFGSEWLIRLQSRLAAKVLNLEILLNFSVNVLRITRTPKIRNTKLNFLAEMT